MSNRRLSAPPLKDDRPSRPLGVVAAIACVAVATALIYPLKEVSPVVSLGVLYVPARGLSGSRVRRARCARRPASRAAPL